ncbi:MAG: NAD regulator, partial [Alphaproteobacteria bacterium]
MNSARRAEIEIGLNAVIVAVDDGTPLVLAINADAGGVPSLPFGPFNPIRHRTFEIGLRSWVEEQTSLSLGYVEQLYTFGDRGRHAREGDSGHIVSVGYLALTHRNPDADRALDSAGAKWRQWYDFFPWEDWRDGRPGLLENEVQPALENWVGADPTGAPPGRLLGRRDRFRQAFADV